MLGTLVNALAVVVGSAIGVSLRRHIPEGMHEILMQGLGLAVLVIGMQMGPGTHHVLVVIISMAVGGVLGEALGIEARLNRLGLWAGARLGAREEGRTFAPAFLASSLLLCVVPPTLHG